MNQNTEHIVLTDNGKLCRNILEPVVPDISAQVEKKKTLTLTNVLKNNHRTTLVLW